MWRFHDCNDHDSTWRGHDTKYDYLCPILAGPSDCIKYIERLAMTMSAELNVKKLEDVKPGGEHVGNGYHAMVYLCFNDHGDGLDEVPECGCR